MNKILEVNKLSFAYGAEPVFEELSFTVAAGDFIALAGPNGAGKTTLVRLILGLETRTSGQISLLGESSSKKIPWKQIGYLAQKNNLFNPLFPARVEEVVGLGLLAQKKYFKRLNSKDQERIADVLAYLKIDSLKHKSINDLSGGEQQKVFLARALVSKPKLLIMDEPNTALDPASRQEFFEIIKSLNDQGVTIIMITHDTAQAGLYAKQLLYLDKKIVFYGPFKDFCLSKEMEQYFGPFSQHLICHQH